MSEFKQTAAILAFRRGRRSEALWLCAASAGLLCVTLFFNQQWTSILPVGGVLLLLSVVFGYTGFGGRAVWVALLLGTIPLSCATIAQHVGHMCTPHGCVSWCLPMCLLGGSVAGILLARTALASTKPVASFVGGAALVFTTGALGCACVGMGGIGGMGLGLLVSSAATLAMLRARTSR